MPGILNYTFSELKDELVGHGIEAYRISSIFKWIYRKTVFDFNEMSDLPKNLRAHLAQNYNIIELVQKGSIRSADGQTMKFLLVTDDNHYIESVLIVGKEFTDEQVHPGRLTVCVSTQVGCGLGCKFCATGLMGIKRNLTVAEIVSQVMLLEVYYRKRFRIEDGRRAITNVVFMGMGEPLLNFDNVMKAIKILNFSGGFNLGMRHFTISTAGIPKRIMQLADMHTQLRLAVSLNSAIEEKRMALMPIAQKYSLSELLKAVSYYQNKTRRRVTFEYVLIDGINDGEHDVIALKHTLDQSGIKYNLNLIAYNSVPEIPFKQPSPRAYREFRIYLKKYGIPFVERVSKGEDIAAACGQLSTRSRQNNFINS